MVCLIHLLLQAKRISRSCSSHQNRGWSDVHESTAVCSTKPSFPVFLPKLPLPITFLLFDKSFGKSLKNNSCFKIGK